MDRKKAPHKLQVEDSKQDDNSIVEMTQAKMDELKIFRGDAVILKGKSFVSHRQTSAGSSFSSGHPHKWLGCWFCRLFYQKLAAHILTLMIYSA